MNFAHEATPQEKLKAISELIDPCCPPDVHNGYDLCPGHPGQGWPCKTTRAAWIARGLDPAAETSRTLREMSKPTYYYSD